MRHQTNRKWVIAIEWVPAGVNPRASLTHRCWGTSLSIEQQLIRNNYAKRVQPQAPSVQLITSFCSWTATSNRYTTDFCILISILVHSFKKAMTWSFPQFNARVSVRTRSNVQISHNSSPMLYKMLTSVPWLCLLRHREQWYMSCGVTNQQFTYYICFGTD